MSRKNARAQVTGTRRSAAHQRSVEDIRRSSAAQPHRSNRDYRRKPKHAEKGWE